ncbi:hypothetical protein [Granulicella sp. dw_53]|uniref:hypothetical protein n=1 Tax=Granulicella sp. dw_53 TaxID=2719792 RepID=UPI001BD58DE6|nr:hypothetical protein [Granulicella sp. dw_53]
MELQKPTPRRADLVSPIMFVVILTLIVGFIAAFLILRPARGIPKEATTSSQSSPAQK